MLLTTIARELFTTERFGRIPESRAVVDSEEAVSAFIRAAAPGGILSGVYAFCRQQACNLLRSGDRVLDLGCGPASLLASLAALNPDCNFVGIDTSTQMAAAGNATLRSAGMQNVELRVDDMCSMSSVEPRSIDVVLSSMALHHLPDMAHLQRCFAAVERVVRPGARLFMLDFGRLRSLSSIEYFVRRAIPKGEPLLAKDYRASLRAAFSPAEFSNAFPEQWKNRVCVYSTAVSPVIVVLTSRPPGRRRQRRALNPADIGLPPARRADYRQLLMALRLGGMPVG